MDADLRLLLQAWLNDDVDHDALEPAMQRLEQDAEFRRQFMDELSMIGLTRVARAKTPEWERLTLALDESDLEQRVMAALDGDATSAGRPALLASPSTTREVWWRNVGLSASLVALLLLVALLRRDPPGAGGQAGVNLPGGLPAVELPAGQFRDDGVAILVRSVDAQWESDVSWQPGDILSPGRLVLTSGLAQIEFYSGAQVILEGSADLTVVSADEAICHQGRLRAQVPPHARGFRIASADFDVVDLGTEFGMEVSSDGQSKVHVFDGEVELHRSGSTQPALERRVTEGEAVAWQSGDALSAIPPEPERFASFEMLREQSRDAARRRFRVWQDWTALQDADPRLLVRYRFSAENGLQVVGQLADSAASVVGCGEVPGRWSSQPALEFLRPSDRIRVDLPGSYDAITFTAWVRIDALPARDQTLLLTDANPQLRLHWQLTPGGELFLGLRRPLDMTAEPRPKPEWTGHGTQRIFTTRSIGKWTHLATVYDREQRRVSHFLDGKRVSTAVVDYDHALQLGLAAIGNFGRPIAEPDVIRNFVGRMDEVSLWQAALDEDTLREHFEYGKP